MRKKWIVLPEFQYHFINRMSALFVFFILLLGAHAYYYMNYLFELGKAAQLPSDHVYFSFINTVIAKYLLSFSMTLILSAGIFYIFGIYLSNKIAGPLYRISENIKKDGNNKVTIALRKNDYFKDLAALINEKLISKKQKTTEN